MASLNSTMNTETRRAFSITEMLVVIAIIGLLVALLLPVLKGVRNRAKATTTQGTMNEFSKACDAFFLEHNRYPGIIPEASLRPAASTTPPPISGTENALLELMGGAVRNDINATQYAGYGTGWTEITFADNWRIKVNPKDIGQGPNIGGKPYAPYFTPSASELAVANGQIGVGTGQPQLPDLIDAWGQPIMYLRQIRTTTIGATPTLVGASNIAQFSRAGIEPYLNSTRLGEFGKDQVYVSGTNTAGSMLTWGNPVQQAANLAQLLRNPVYGEANLPQTGTARAAYALFSAGPDGIYFSATDGPGTSASPVTNIVNGTEPGSNTPRIADEYDDVRVFGGG